MITITPPPKTRRRRAIEAELATLAGITEVAAAIDRSRERVEQLAYRFNLGIVIGPVKMYWPEDVDFLRRYIATHGRVTANHHSRRNPPTT